METSQPENKFEQSDREYREEMDAILKEQLEIERQEKEEEEKKFKEIAEIERIDRYIDEEEAREKEIGDPLYWEKQGLPPDEKDDE
jgi:hypothetical protein